MDLLPSRSASASAPRAGPLAATTGLTLCSGNRLLPWGNLAGRRDRPGPDRSAGDVAAVDVELQPGDEGGVVAREVGDAGRDLLGRPGGPSASGRHRLLEGRAPRPVEDRGVDEPGWIELTRTPSVGPVQRDVLRQRADRALGRVVGRRGAEAAAGAEDRADVDDRAVTRCGQRGRRVFMPRKTPVWSMAMVRSQSARVVSSIAARSPMPALLTRMSSPPNSSSAGRRRPPSRAARDVVRGKSARAPPSRRSVPRRPGRV